jgi:hypothetical protein
MERETQLRIERQRNGSVIVRGIGSVAERADLAKRYLQHSTGQNTNADADADGRARQAMLDGLARKESLRSLEDRIAYEE